jgi:hypothetical protein
VEGNNIWRLSTGLQAVRFEKWWSYTGLFLQVRCADFVDEDSSLEADGYWVHVPPFIECDVSLRCTI